MTSKTVAFGGALVLARVLLGMNVPTVAAQRDGPYAISQGNIGPGKTASIWRLSQGTGQVSFCFVTTARIQNPPFCSPWGPAIRR